MTRAMPARSTHASDEGADTASFFTPQPYPLFYGHRPHGGELLIGRVVGWDQHPGGMPRPVVAFTDHEFGVYPPVAVNVAVDMAYGRSWLCGSVDEVRAAGSTSG